MAWTTPSHSKSRVDRAGRTLADGVALSTIEEQGCLEIVNNWRSAHSFPLNTIQMLVRRHGRRISSKSLTAQRIKRLPSIVAKLQRKQSMRLSQLQDVGGCRCVLDTIGQVRRMRDALARSATTHKIVGEDDYLTTPKPDGYRSLHLIYKYSSPKSPAHEGLLIEVQLRSRLQHGWATAVEIVDTFLRTSLKSSIGPDSWKRFFVLASAAIAIKERATHVAGAPTDKAILREELRALSGELKVRSTLEAFGNALAVAETEAPPGIENFLLELNPVTKTLSITGFHDVHASTATDEYLKAELALKKVEGGQAVLVAADSMQALRRAYPNYFLDSAAFLNSLDEFLAVS
ncbi:MAG: RelA/SpoT domain-containing protein [Gemmatimonadota bacterium]